MHQIGVGVVAAEIGQRRAVAHGAGGRAKLTLENRVRIRPGDGVHGVEGEPQAPRERRPQRVEVEQLAHQLDVIRDRIDHLDLHFADAEGARAANVYIGRVHGQDFRDPQRLGVDRVRDLLGRRPAIGRVELDAEIAIRPAGIVARRKDQAAESLVLADNAGCGGRGENAAGAHERAAETVGRRDADHRLDRLGVVVAPVAANHERQAAEPFRWPDGVEHGLHEVRQVIALRKLGGLLTEPAGAGLHAGDGAGGDAFDDHGKVPRKFQTCIIAPARAAKPLMRRSIPAHLKAKARRVATRKALQRWRCKRPA